MEVQKKLTWVQSTWVEGNGLQQDLCKQGEFSCFYDYRLCDWKRLRIRVTNLLLYFFPPLFLIIYISGVSDEEDQKPVRLPLKVAVELQPRSNHSWTRVQSLAHNPRLRLVSPVFDLFGCFANYLNSFRSLSILHPEAFWFCSCFVFLNFNQLMSFKTSGP